MQELSVAQSSLFLQAIIIGGAIGTGLGKGRGGSVGREVGCSASGAGGLNVDPCMGTISSSWCGSTSSKRGLTVEGLCVNIALQCFVGLPVVPGGHMQDGRWSIVTQSAFSPQRPG